MTPNPKEHMEKIAIDVNFGFEQAASVLVNANRQNSEEYKSACQHSMIALNRALANAVEVFLDQHKIAKKQTHSERINQIRQSRFNPLDQSQFNALFEINNRRNQLEHLQELTYVELWEVQRAVSIVQSVMPRLILGVDWAALWLQGWTIYGSKLGQVNEKAKSHNLPNPDYQVFVGRRNELDRLYQLLEHPRQWIVSIEGIGGVGKSALALKFAWEMVECIEKQNCPWKHLIWVSAKFDRLPPDASGIEKINQNFQALEDLFDQILLVCGWGDYVNKSKEERLEAVTTILENEPCLLFIDNYETIQDPRVADFINDLPGSNLGSTGHKVIITTRHVLAGMGHPVQLAGLEESEAKRLVRQTAKEFKVVQLFQDDDVMQRVLKETGKIPLALRLVVGQVSLGRSIGDVLTKLSQRPETIHKFCFEASVNDLDEDHLKLLYAMSRLKEPADIETISNIANFSKESVGDMLDVIMRYSLVIRTLSNLGEDLFYLLPLTATYCVSLQSKWPEYSRIVTKSAKEEGERQRTVLIANALYRKYNAGKEEERVAVAAAKNALDEYERGHEEDAFKMLQEAKSLAPNLGYIYLIEGQLLANKEQMSDAEIAFKKSSDLDGNNIELLNSWGEFEMTCGKYSEATKLFERAVLLNPDEPMIRLNLAEIYFRQSTKQRIEKHVQASKKSSDLAIQNAKLALFKGKSGLNQRRHNSNAYRLIIKSYYQKDDVDNALQFCGLALEEDPEDIGIRKLEGEIRKGTFVLES